MAVGLNEREPGGKKKEKEEKNEMIGGYNNLSVGTAKNAQKLEKKEREKERTAKRQKIEHHRRTWLAINEGKASRTSVKVTDDLTKGPYPEDKEPGGPYAGTEEASIPLQAEFVFP
ncbi:hypothetical protein E3N88_25154 [Mikania micrantha]|uniref:Uncharacterized protein n=1 Tax=Mikania micrantha TaxID=192012 RepID=A0A5N6N5E5_9ASTR|nr:hypothetical protein E3N88_25154 [Mikania micrantha]